jgi:hypothetical protein
MYNDPAAAAGVNENRVAPPLPSVIEMFPADEV